MEPHVWEPHVRNADIIKIVVLLPVEEVFSGYSGGAVARWVYETYRRLPTTISVKVFGRTCKTNYQYPLPMMIKLSWLCDVVMKVPLVRRMCAYFWCLSCARLAMPDAHLINVQNAPQYVLLLRRFGLSAPSILHMHNDYLSSVPKSLIEDLHDNVDLIVCCSHFIKRQIAKRSRHLEKLAIVIPNGIDLDRFRIKGVVKDNKPIRVLYVGRISAGKGIQNLLMAFNRLNYSDRIELVIAGSGGLGGAVTSYERKCRKVARTLGDHRGRKITFTGHVAHDELPKLYQSADIVVVPSTCNEAFGMVILEAMACGVPVIASDVGGIVEASGAAAYMVPVDNVGDLSAAIDVLASNFELRMKMSLAGIEHVKAYEWSRVADKWDNVLRGVIEV